MNVLIFFSLFSKRRDFEISCCCMMHCRSKVLWGKNGLSFLICARTDAFLLYKICRHGIRNLTEAINSNWIWRWKSRYQERERPWWEHWQLLRAIAVTLPSSLSRPTDLTNHLVFESSETRGDCRGSLCTAVSQRSSETVVMRPRSTATT